ncbi:TRCF domain-containing protein [Phenylobacterium sp. LjRoot219]|uniref:TRCF domain-containing protein n=1 Tax=Phenylobacterium sp. LjRoot219 TaxID=3342283 RepID=UPI003F50A8CC
MRINLYARLARITEFEEAERFAEELEDRFGPPPEECAGLLALVRLQALARAAGVARVDAGPKGIALTPIADAPATLPDGLEVSGGRLVLRTPAEDVSARIDEVRALLEALSA